MGPRFVIAVALALVAVRAEAQPASPAPPEAAAERTCTTTTTVVKRGDVMLSSTSSTRCEDEPGSGDGRNASGLRKAPAAVLAGPGEILKSLSLGGGVQISPKNVRGDWHTLEPGSQRVCHLFLTSQPTDAGLRVRIQDCRGPLGAVKNWRFENDSVALYAPGEKLVVRLRGERDALEGQAEDGRVMMLQR